MNIVSQYKGLRRENYVLCFGRLVTGMGSMIWPMLTMILNQKMGMGGKHIAWVIAAVGILSLPANLAGGKTADNYNKKMNIVYLDMVSVACYFICAAIPLSAVTMALMAVAATCQSMEGPSYNALTADITATEDRERAYSLQYLGGNLGFVMSPTIAGFLFQDYLWLAFLISGIAIGCSTILIYIFVKDIEPVKEEGERAVYQVSRAGESLWGVLKGNKTILLYILVISGYYATYQMYNYLMPLDLARLHGESGAVIYGSVTSVNCAVVVIFTPLITRLFSRLSEPVKTVLGQGLLMAGFVLFVVFAGHIPVYYIAMVILTWGEIFGMLAESPYLTRRMPASHRGRINGLVAVVRTGFTSVYQLLIGFIYEAGASAAAWTAVLAIGGFFVLAAVWLAAIDRKAYRNLYLSVVSNRS